ncbi:hypothetical protein Rifp1Sym_cg00010 [endosymbiont of Riftia pachyptila (vent Ph05)]|uniref:Uncharacterized protein n=1 Tax=endosymbiont of Riftia pachyptila (vent Ph05) TaxID=1048808 RepID=G2DEU0_9GAMM|nr:hypothetical protein Rifp1Sym_cg00010 [endosymbiont of Riftia pachyptila (vent Ph05)]
MADSGRTVAGAKPLLAHGTPHHTDHAQQHQGE